MGVVRRLVIAGLLRRLPLPPFVLLPLPGLLRRRRLPLLRQFGLPRLQPPLLRPLVRLLARIDGGRMGLAGLALIWMSIIMGVCV